VKQSIKKQKEITENPHSLFFDCFEKVLYKRVALVNPNIFKTTGATMQPDFVQKIPDQAYRSQKRGSVFHKVDMGAMDFNNIPNYYKPPEQVAEIITLLRKSFLTKNLSEAEVEKLAGAMKPRIF
jgi:hypothetical protein